MSAVASYRLDNESINEEFHQVSAAEEAAQAKIPFAKRLEERMKVKVLERYDTTTLQNHSYVIINAFHSSMVRPRNKSSESLSNFEGHSNFGPRELTPPETLFPTARWRK